MENTNKKMNKLEKITIGTGIVTASLLTFLTINSMMPNLAPKYESNKRQRNMDYCWHVLEDLWAAQKKQDYLQKAAEPYKSWAPENCKVSAAHWDGGPLPGWHERLELEYNTKKIDEDMKYLKENCKCK